MFALIRHPLAIDRAVLTAVVIVAAVTLYCLAYTALAGRAESPMEGVRWALVNIVPFFAAFEAAKRTGSWRNRVFLVAAALAVSLALDAMAGATGAPGFAIVRRLPAVALVIALLLIGRFVTRLAATPPDAGSVGNLRAVLRDTDWISAAGNYVELHRAGRTTLHRAPLRSVEARLALEGFVRIHRSTLVRRNRIASVRAVDVVLVDGTSLKIGKRYRSRLAG